MTNWFKFTPAMSEGWAEEGIGCHLFVEAADATQAAARAKEAGSYLPGDGVCMTDAEYRADAEACRQEGMKSGWFVCEVPLHHA